MAESSVRAKLEQVLERIHAAASSVGRDPDAVRLVVVTKGHKLDIIRDAIDAGASILGENYVDEALSKMEHLPEQYEVEWHMIGHIQSRKARMVVENFAYVHSLDSYKLAARLDRFSGEINRKLPVLLECNVSGEGSKYGFSAWSADLWQTLAEQAERIADLRNLDIRGLMAMPPYFDDPEQARPYFQRLVLLRSYLRDRLPRVNWSELSMGMSGDYEVAVQEGATLVRIGTAILGSRPD